MTTQQRRALDTLQWYHMVIILVLLFLCHSTSAQDKVCKASDGHIFPVKFRFVLDEQLPPNDLFERMQNVQSIIQEANDILFKKYGAGVVPEAITVVYGCSGGWNRDGMNIDIYAAGCSAPAVEPPHTSSTSRFTTNYHTLSGNEIVAKIERYSSIWILFFAFSCDRFKSLTIPRRGYLSNGVLEPGEVCDTYPAFLPNSCDNGQFSTTVFPRIANVPEGYVATPEATCPYRCGAVVEPLLCWNSETNEVLPWEFCSTLVLHPSTSQTLDCQPNYSACTMRDVVWKIQNDDGTFRAPTRENYSPCHIRVSDDDTHYTPPHQQTPGKCTEGLVRSGNIKCVDEATSTILDDALCLQYYPSKPLAQISCQRNDPGYVSGSCYVWGCFASGSSDDGDTTTPQYTSNCHTTDNTTGYPISTKENELHCGNTITRTVSCFKMDQSTGKFTAFTTTNNTNEGCSTSSKPSTELIIPCAYEFQCPVDGDMDMIDGNLGSPCSDCQSLEYQGCFDIISDYTHAVCVGINSIFNVVSTYNRDDYNEDPEAINEHSPCGVFPPTTTNCWESPTFAQQCQLTTYCRPTELSGEDSFESEWSDVLVKCDDPQFTSIMTQRGLDVCALETPPIGCGKGTLREGSFEASCYGRPGVADVHPYPDEACQSAPNTDCFIECTTAPGWRCAAYTIDAEDTPVDEEYLADDDNYSALLCYNQRDIHTLYPDQACGYYQYRIHPKCYHNGYEVDPSECPLDGLLSYIPDYDYATQPSASIRVKHDNNCKMKCLDALRYDDQLQSLTPASPFLLPPGHQLSCSRFDGYGCDEQCRVGQSHRATVCVDAKTNMVLYRLDAPDDIPDQYEGLCHVPETTPTANAECLVKENCEYEMRCRFVYNEQDEETDPNHIDKLTSLLGAFDTESHENCFLTSPPVENMCGRVHRQSTCFTRPRPSPAPSPFYGADDMAHSHAVLADDWVPLPDHLLATCYKKDLKNNLPVDDSGVSYRGCAEYTCRYTSVNNEPYNDPNYSTETCSQSPICDGCGFKPALRAHKCTNIITGQTLPSTDCSESPPTQQVICAGYTGCAGYELRCAFDQSPISPSKQFCDMNAFKCDDYDFCGRHRRTFHCFVCLELPADGNQNKCTYIEAPLSACESYVNNYEITHETTPQYCSNYYSCTRWQCSTFYQQLPSSIDSIPTSQALCDVSTPPVQACSQSCGTGTSSRFVRCMQNGREVDNATTCGRYAVRPYNTVPCDTRTSYTCAYSKMCGYLDGAYTPCAGYSTTPPQACTDMCSNAASADMDTNVEHVELMYPSRCMAYTNQSLTPQVVADRFCGLNLPAMGSCPTSDAACCDTNSSRMHDGDDEHDNDKHEDGNVLLPNEVVDNEIDTDLHSGSHQASSPSLIPSLGSGGSASIESYVLFDDYMVTSIDDICEQLPPIVFQSSTSGSTVLMPGRPTPVTWNYNGPSSHYVSIYLLHRSHSPFPIHITTVKAASSTNAGRGSAQVTLPFNTPPSQQAGPAPSLLLVVDTTPQRTVEIPNITIESACRVTVPCHADHGTCNAITGQCDCKEGYSGPSCSLSRCSTFPCINGKCIAKSDDDPDVLTCECYPGFSGDDCSQYHLCTAENSPVCENGGYPVASIPSTAIRGNNPITCPKCQCPHQFTPSDNCRTCQLEHQCEPYGTVDDQCSKCNCKPGYYGEFCNCKRVYISLTYASVPQRIIDYIDTATSPPTPSEIDSLVRTWSSTVLNDLALDFMYPREHFFLESYGIGTGNRRFAIVVGVESCTHTTRPFPDDRVLNPADQKQSTLSSSQHQQQEQEYDAVYHDHRNNTVNGDQDDPEDNEVDVDPWTLLTNTTFRVGNLTHFNLLYTELRTVVVDSSAMRSMETSHEPAPLHSAHGNGPQFTQLQQGGGESPSQLASIDPVVYHRTVLRPPAVSHGYSSSFTGGFRGYDNIYDPDCHAHQLDQSTGTRCVGAAEIPVFTSILDEYAHQGKKSGLSTGALVGIIIGNVVVVIIIVAIIVFSCIDKREKKRKRVREKRPKVAMTSPRSNHTGKPGMSSGDVGSGATGTLALPGGSSSRSNQSGYHRAIPHDASNSAAHLPASTNIMPEVLDDDPHLHPDWKKIRGPQGEVMYWNDKTMTSSLHRPDDEAGDLPSTCFFDEMNLTKPTGYY